VEKLEARMQKVSLAISIISMGLMCAGLVDILFGGTPYSLPGEAVLPFGDLVRLSGGSIGTLAVSFGVILLGLIPAIRVSLALMLYIRIRDGFSTLVTIAVALELLASIYLGAG
ncbi:MAG: hypothetical protein P8X55_14710, partial [Desulfosarcinaceae bacterium]